MGNTVAAPATVELTERINRIEVSATLAVVNEAEKMRAQGADLVDFGAGEPHFATPAHIKRAGIEAIEHDFTKYTAVGGTGELREAIAQRHSKDFGSDYKSNEVCASTGGKQALFNAIQVLVQKGDDVIVPSPYWVSFKDIVRYAGGNCVLVETSEENGFALTAAMVERALTPRTKAMILNSPCNPSGAVMSPDDGRAIARLAQERGFTVVADECYQYLDYTGRSFSIASVREAREHIVVCGSLSKTYAMTGWRLGYAMGPARIVGAISKLQSQSTSNANSISQYAAIAALTGPQQCVADMKAEYVQLRDRALAALRSIPGVRCTKPDGAFYLYPNISAYFGRGGVRSASDIAGRLLREAGVVVVPGEGFGTREHVRVSYATSAQAIDRGMDRMKQWFAKL